MNRERNKNKGEWSEFYAFLKMLGDGKVKCANGQLEPYPNRYNRIRKIFADDAANRTTYEIHTEDDTVVVTQGEEQLILDRSVFSDESKLVWKFIQDNCRDEKLDPIYDFMDSIRRDKVSAKSTDKADIRLVIHHHTMGDMPEQGFSIKSKAGNPSTLLNASTDNTNFVYEIITPSPDQVRQFNEADKFVKKFAVIDDCQIKFVGVAEDVLRINLCMIDGDIERILAECLLKKFKRDRFNKIKSIIAEIAEEDPLHICAPNNLEVYRVKMKHLLLSSALGFTPGTLWDGRHHASGGIIVVKEDSDVVCIHFYDKDDLEDYLYEKTFFETPSTGRHMYGSIYEEDGRFFTKLNLQIRFGE